ncbi:MAG: LysM peptidoglycan-binding domain-containing protein [Thermoanaerobacteraceae bacterium]|nr:LysM peptidoglycan-binding domain-containing protein [Thermoanaerobacteraceae bacterium]
MSRRRVKINKTAIRRRLALLAGVLVITMIFILGAAVFDFSEARAGSDSGLAVVVVERGDTLWSICKELGVKGDLRLTIYRIREINGLSSADIYPGQELLVPVNVQ